MAEGKKSKAWKELLGRLLGAERKEIAVVLVYGLGAGILSLAVPIAVQALVNTVTFGSLSQPLLFLVLAVFVGLFVAGAFRTIQVVVVERIQVRFFAHVALEVAALLPRSRMEGVAGTRFSELVNRFFDVLVVQKSAASLLLEGFALLMQTLVGLVLLAFYHPALLAFDLVLVATIGAVLFWLGRGAVATAIEESAHKYRVAAWLEEIAARSDAFRTVEARRFAFQRTDELVVGYLDARQGHFRVLLRQVIGSLGLQAGASAALLALGAYLVVREQLTLGQLIAAELVVTGVLSSLAKFQKQLEAFYDLAAALDKIGALLALPLERDGGSTRVDGKGPAGLALRDVRYRHPGSPFELAVGRHEIRAGSSLAIEGPNGSGKSTLVDLLYGLRAAAEGTVLLDGVDYRELAPEEIRRHVALARPGEMVTGSILENVIFGRAEVTPEAAKEALARVGILDAALETPDGLASVIVEGSWPPAELVLLARAIAGRPRLLLVDELLDGLDKKTRGGVLDALLDESAPWTLVLATREPELARRCRETLSLEAPRRGRAA